MIRINLVGETRKPVVAKPGRARGSALGGFTSGDNAANILLVVPIVLALLFAGYTWWSLSRTVKENRTVIAEKQRRVDELKEIIERVEAYERQEAELKNKIAVITQLKDNQSGPVEMMDVISRSLPDLLWLDRLDLNGERVTIDGQAYNYNAVATFIRSLDDSTFFDEPVLQDTNLRGDVLTYRISLRLEKRTNPEAAATP